MTTRFVRWLVAAGLALSVSWPAWAWAQEKVAPPAPPPPREGETPRGKPEGRTPRAPSQPRRPQGVPEFGTPPGQPPGGTARPAPNVPMPPHGGRPGDAAGPGGVGPSRLGGGGNPGGPGGPGGRRDPLAGSVGPGGFGSGPGAQGRGPGGPGFFDWEQLRRDDPEMYELQRADVEMDRQVLDLADGLRRANAENREQLKKQIQDLVQRHFDVRQKRRQLNLTRIEQDLQRMRDELKRREEARETIITRRTAELIGNHDELDF